MAIQGLVPAIEIDETDKIGTAVTKLREAGALFGVVTSVRGERIGVVSVNDLSKEDNKRTIETVVPENPEIKIVDSPETLGEVVENHAKDLELRPNLQGIVVTEGVKIIGVLPRNLIITGATRVVTRGTGISRIEGPPLGALFFTCHQDNEKKMVTYYDPHNPPRCSKDHVMELEE